MEYSIFPLPLAETGSASVIYSWLIQGGNIRMLVDPGVNAEDINRFSARGLSGKKITSFEEGLSRFGLKPAQIDNIIITHLHYDHFVNTSKCKNAKTMVQKKELDFALNPHPLFARSFQKEWYEGINFNIIDGDKEIAPGIRVLLTPGYTAGNQSVLIQTSKGKALITGFCSHFEDLFPERYSKADRRVKLPVNIPEICFYPMEAYDSALRVKEIADILVPCHDLSFRQGQPIR